jgi:lipopolysaccharide export system protein LptA
MIPWQRRLRLGLAVFIIALVVTIVVSLRRPAAPVAPPPLPKSDPNAVAESRSGRSLRVLGGKPDISVEHYDQMVQYADGRMRLSGVRFKVLQRRGRDFVITSATADVAGQAPNEDVRLKGAVEISSSDGLTVRTEEASYAHATGVVRAPAAVAFARSGMTGTAVGVTYDEHADLLSLLDRVVIHRDPDRNGQGGLDIEAGSASLARAEKTMRFGHHVRVVREGETFSADEITAYLTGDDRRVQRLELRGGSSVTGTPKADGGLQAMRARDIDLSYAADGTTLQQAVLNVDATIELAGAGSAAGRRLSGQFIDVDLAADGATVASLLARDRVVLELFPDPSTPARTIRSGLLQAAGAAGSGLQAATFGDGVDFRESPPAPAAVRTAASSTLALALRNGFGQIESARFGGGVVFTQGSLTARAREAQYAIAAGTLRMSGHDEKTGRAPQVIDGRATIEGGTIDVLLDGPTVTASGPVTTEMRGGGEPAGPREGAPAGGSEQLRVPSMLQADKPVHASADRLVYDGRAALATYTGGAALWQDEVSIKADTIILDEHKAGLSARGNVVSRLLFGRAGGKAAKDEPTGLVVTSAQMVFDDQADRATYTGGAHLDGWEGDLSADRIAVILNGGAHEMERLEADGKVALRTPEGRKAAGTQLIYQARTGQYDMAGTPVRLDDEFGQTTGNSLTFFRSAARIIVDGKEQKRTELRREIKR